VSEERNNAHLIGELGRCCSDLLREIILDPGVRVFDIRVRTVVTTRFESAKEQVCYIVEAKTNDASLLRGDTALFKGSYKERVEAVLDVIVKRADPNAWAHLEILGPSPPSVERVIPITRLLKSGQLREDSPLVVTAKTYGLRYALIRGRHFVGPSPAIARTIEQLIGDEGCRPESVLDLFAGSGIASIVVCRYTSPKMVLAIERDRAKISRLQRYLAKSRARCLAADACKVALPKRLFDLVVADPYYEDALVFLQHHLRWIARYARRFLMVSGGIEHAQWNGAVERMIRSAGLKPRVRRVFGQVILDSQMSRG
jgi:predicted RNA methylase